VLPTTPDATSRQPFDKPAIVNPELKRAQAGVSWVIPVIPEPLVTIVYPRMLELFGGEEFKLQIQVKVDEEI
jgi:hypothetical protein